jgi:hypothetical protein
MENSGERLGPLEAMKKLVAGHTIKDIVYKRSSVDFVFDGEEEWCMRIDAIPGPRGTVVGLMIGFFPIKPPTGVKPPDCPPSTGQGEKP